MELLTALRQRTEQAEVFTVESESTKVSFEANVMKSAAVEETQGVALRGVVDGQMGFTAASGQAAEVSDDVGAELIEALLASARYGEKAPFSLPSPAQAEVVSVYDPSLAQVPMERFVEIGREVIAALIEVDPDVKVNVEIERSTGHVVLRNSFGVEVGQQSSAFSLGISIERVRGDDVLLAYDAVDDVSLTDDYRNATARIAEKIERAQRGAKLKSGEMPVLFSPAGAMVLALPLMLAVNGENVQRGTSPLSDKVGKMVFDPRLTLWDDPTLPGRPGSSSYDDEGVPCRRKALVEKGISVGFVYDLRTAALMGTESTGNGSRSLFALPSPSPSNLILESGDSCVADMVAGIDRGLLVEQALGLGQGNAISGAFSNTLGLAFVIEGGEIVGRLKDVSIAGSIYEDMREVAALSRESYWVHGRFRLPYVLLPSLNVVCKD